MARWQASGYFPDRLRSDLHRLHRYPPTAARRSPAAGAGRVAIDALFDRVLVLRLIGGVLGMVPVTALRSVVFWSWVLGPIGAVLSEPLTRITERPVLRRYPDTRSLARLISNDAAMPEQCYASRRR